MKIVFCLLLLFSHAATDDFLLSFRQSARNHAILNEKLLIARAMIPAENRDLESSFTLSIAPLHRGKSLYELLNAHRDELLETMLQNGILLTDSAETTPSATRAKTVITIPTVRISAVIKGDTVKISIYESQ
jgi:hypothetical protein